MKLIGFNFTKIIAEKNKEFKKGSITTDMEFLNIEKEKTQLLKDTEVIKLDFRFSVFYKDSSDKNAKVQGQINLNGTMLLAGESNEGKQLLDSWKKKQVPDSMKVSLLNIIIKKCSIKAMALEEELNLPSHIPLPRLSGKK